MKAKPVALVTGATSGIGEATAYRLQARGHMVFAAGRNPVALDTLRSRGLEARTFDVTDEAAVTRLVEEIHTDYGGVDVLVNNAGFGLSSPLEQVALSDLRSIFETNVVAMLHLSQAVLPGMRARGAGTIVNIGSTGGRWTTPGVGAYHISKYGLSRSVTRSSGRSNAVRCSRRVDRPDRGPYPIRRSPIRANAVGRRR